MKYKINKNKIIYLLIFFVAIATTYLILNGGGNYTDNEKQGIEPDYNNQEIKGTTKDSFYLFVNENEAKNLVLENQDNPDFKVIDIRTKEEFLDGHIPGAKNIDFSDKNFVDQISSLDKNKHYLVYCRTNNRSIQATDYMKEVGFRYIYNLNTGYLSWINSKL